MTEKARTAQQRREQGRALREKTPRRVHADWSPSRERANPVELLEAQNESRVQSLVPVRRARMSASPFAFFRGAARIMAHDLASTESSGLVTQICGDAHLANFGSYASPERRLVFDLNDFDETLPGPWEWDVKRLAASLTIAGRHNGLKKGEVRKVTQRAVNVYRSAMIRLAEMRVTDVWYHLVEPGHLVEDLEDDKLKKATHSLLKKAKRRDSRQALNKLAEEVDGEHRIRSAPPLLVPLRDLEGHVDREDLWDLALRTLEEYRETVSDHIAHLLGQFRLIDVAVKVVGVGSVGTRCYVLLLEGNHAKDPLFLQVKQAGRSVLEEHLPRSRYKVSGRRVVEGQRLIQTVSDIFLGWAESEISGNHFYVRQLRDWKISADVEGASYEALHAIAATRGWTLARAHARTGDPIAIAGYLGAGKAFDRAVTEFAVRYADQNERDHEAFSSEIRAGRLEASELE